MTGGPGARALVGGAAVAILLGLTVSFCQHRDIAPAPSGCDGVVSAVPVRATRPGSSSMSRKNIDPPPSRLRKDPPRPVVTKTATPRPVVTPSKARTGHGHHPDHEIDVDLDLDGC
ncbi:hypothetical protein GTY54_22415 [Streptomyces sp. SID625]|nr:hypothetical protein [Streptomyces sp. SID625]